MAIRFGTKTVRDIPTKFIISRLLQTVDALKLRFYEPYPMLPRDYVLDFPEPPDDEHITHGRLWWPVANMLRPGDIVLGNTGTSGHGVRELALPQYTRIFTHATWLCVGYARTVLFTGDGGF